MRGSAPSHEGLQRVSGRGGGCRPGAAEAARQRRARLRRGRSQRLLGLGLKEGSRDCPCVPRGAVRGAAQPLGPFLDKVKVITVGERCVWALGSGSGLLTCRLTGAPCGERWGLRSPGSTGGSEGSLPREAPARAGIRARPHSYFKWKETQRWGLDPSPLAKCLKPPLRATERAWQAAVTNRAAWSKQTHKCEVMKSVEGGEDGQVRETRAGTGWQTFMKKVRLLLWFTYTKLVCPQSDNVGRQCW